MGGMLRIILNLALLIAVCLAASTDTSKPTTEVSSSTSLPSSSTGLPTTLVPTATTNVPKTTTHVPKTTTHVPKTTTHVPKTTTDIPETTTDVPKTTTDVPKTTTDVPTTTVMPKPDVVEGTWNVTDGNVTCIIVELKIEFIIDTGDLKYDIALSPNASTIGSMCYASNVTQVLKLSHENYVLTFVFEKESGNVFVRNVTFDFFTEFLTERFYNDTKLFPVKFGNSYMCRSTETVSMGNATMHIYDIHVQAFRGEGATDFSTAEECEADDSISDIVPIAVACALAALIVVVLIAYLVGRRRNRQKGYTSV